MDLFDDDQGDESPKERRLWHYVATQTTMLLLAGAIALGSLALLAMLLLSLYVHIID